jgi:hypothetical protein
MTTEKAILVKPRSRTRAATALLVAMTVLSPSASGAPKKTAKKPAKTTTKRGKVAVGAPVTAPTKSTWDASILRTINRSPEENSTILSEVWNFPKWPAVPGELIGVESDSQAFAGSTAFFWRRSTTVLVAASQTLDQLGTFFAGEKVPIRNLLPGASGFEVYEGPATWSVHLTDWGPNDGRRIATVTYSLTNPQLFVPDRPWRKFDELLPQVPELQLHREVISLESSRVDYQTRQLQRLTPRFEVARHWIHREDVNLDAKVGPRWKFVSLSPSIRLYREAGGAYLGVGLPRLSGEFTIASVFLAIDIPSAFQ